VQHRDPGEHARDFSDQHADKGRQSYGSSSPPSSLSTTSAPNIRIWLKSARLDREHYHQTALVVLAHESAVLKHVVEKPFAGQSHLRQTYLMARR